MGLKLQTSNSVMMQTSNSGTMKTSNSGRFQTSNSWDGHLSLFEVCNFKAISELSGYCLIWRKQFVTATYKSIIAWGVLTTGSCKLPLFDHTVGA